MANTKSVKLPKDHRWPEGAIVYHIYPRSLQDSNGDGIGDLQGVVSRLDYLKTLNVNAIWLSPFYPSPMADFGYDVADYCDVDPIFGSLRDFKELLDESHKRDIKVMIDLVPSHTSDDHEWFKQSRSSRDNPYADWYIWHDPVHNEESGEPGPPNNWVSVFSGESSWQWEPQRQQYYMHSFDVRQPDLNWTNPAVRAAIKDAMRFWLDMGVDGFRVDAVYFTAKDPILSDDPPNPYYAPERDDKYDALLHENSQAWPMVYGYLSEMADVLKEEKYQDAHRFMVTEAYPISRNPVKDYMEFYVGVDPKVAAPFNFGGITLPWEAKRWSNYLQEFHTALSKYSGDAVASYAFGNHDQPRLINRLGHAEAARSAAVLLLTLPGMAFIYYGEEIGMCNVDIPPEYVHDPEAKRNPLNPMGRDPERTPMQWTSGKYAGFTSGETTWLPIAADAHEVNVESQSEDPASFLSLYRELGHLRHSELAFKIGNFEVVDSGSPEVLAYVRRDGKNKAFLVLVNFAAFIAACDLKIEPKKLILSSKPDSMVKASKQAVLQPYEAAVFSI